MLSNAVWTRERRFRHTNGNLAPSPTCTFYDTNEDEAQERLFWRCPKWEDARREFPLARRVYASTRHLVTKSCGLVLRSESSLHSATGIAQMQSMMATVLKAWHEAGVLAALPNAPQAQAEVPTGDAFRHHDLEVHVATGGEESYRCRRCGAFRPTTTRHLAQEHCDGRPRTHRRHPSGPTWRRT